MKKWDDFVYSHEKGTIFHHSSWIKTIKESYPYQCILYVYKNDKDEICAIFPCCIVKIPFLKKRMVSVCFSDYCFPLSQNCQVSNDMINKIVEKHHHSLNHIEVRGHIRETTCFQCQNYFKHHVLQLHPDVSSVKNKFNKKTIQYSIRKAMRENVKIIECNTIQGMKSFYNLHRMTRKKHGIPTPPFTFFSNIHHNLITKKLGSVLLAVHGSEVIAAGIFFYFKKTIYYKYNASNPAYLTSKKPNHLLTWKAIENGCLNGFQFFDFGRTSPDNTGLMKYKQMWGAQTVDLPYFYYPEIKYSTHDASSPAYIVLSKIWPFIPDVIANRLGPLIYRFSG
jgi:hypothetical protein